MRTIEIQADEALVHTLEELARADSKSLEALTREVLLEYAKKARAWVKPERYSFIGIGHSGRGDLSTQVEEILAEGAKRPHGPAEAGLPRS